MQQLPESSVPAVWSVVGSQRETHDIVTLELAPPAGTGFSFAPGQFNMLYAFGIGEVPISISGNPTASGPIHHTIRDVAPVTHALCALVPGDQVGVRGPYGTHWPVEQAEGGDVVIVAGGLGLLPLRPALYQFLANRDRYRRITLLYGARTPDELLFRSELTEWTRGSALEVEVTVDAAVSGWTGNVGVVPDLVTRARFDPAAVAVFVVGPEIMMRFTIHALLAAGIAEESIFLSVERNMKCAVAMCGHCQLGPFVICRDGAVFQYRTVAPWLRTREL